MQARRAFPGIAGWRPVRHAGAQLAAPQPSSALLKARAHQAGFRPLMPDRISACYSLKNATYKFLRFSRDPDFHHRLDRFSFLGFFAKPLLCVVFNTASGHKFRFNDDGPNPIALYKYVHNSAFYKNAGLLRHGSPFTAHVLE